MTPFITQPHGQHKVALVEDSPRDENRSYEIKDMHNDQSVGMLGSELESLVQWWSSEKKRKQGSDNGEAEPSSGDEA